MSQHPVKVDPLAPGEDCWGKPSAFLALLAKKLFVDLPAGLISKIWQGPSEPPSDKKDWLWYNETAKGKPIGFFSFYKGKQVPVWPAPTGAAPIMIFNGRVDTVVPPFSVCDGRDGTPDLKAQMIVEGTGVAPVSGDEVGGAGTDAANLKDETDLLIGYMQLTGYTD